MNRRAASLLGCGVALCLAGCGRYSDFTLPPLGAGSVPSLVLFPQPAGPVMGPGKFLDVLNPSVVKTTRGYLDLYSGFDGHAWHTALAESKDGLVWQDRGVVLSPDARTWEGAYIAANGSAIESGGRLLYWYQAGVKGYPRIGLAESSDAIHWRKQSGPVLEPGPYGSWDQDGVADPYVIRIEPYFYLYYLGQDRARPTRQRIGVARSKDGRRWEKLRTNPVLELGDPGSFDEAGLGEPAVWQQFGCYWMLYTGRDLAENRRLRLAKSADGVHWVKLKDVFTGDQPWDSKVLCDPWVVVEGDTVRVWFGGGDVASPDENLHGQIGAGRMVPGRVTN